VTAQLARAFKRLVLVRQRRAVAEFERDVSGISKDATEGVSRREQQAAVFDFFGDRGT
jgi:hypothetical protein